MLDDHDPDDCHRVKCLTCLDYSRRESIILLEAAVLELETSTEGAGGEWVDMPVTVDALDIRNVLDLLRQ